MVIVGSGVVVTAAKWTFCEDYTPTVWLRFIAGSLDLFTIISGCPLGYEVRLEDSEDEGFLSSPIVVTFSHVDIYYTLIYFPIYPY